MIRARAAALATAIALGAVACVFVRVTSHPGDRAGVLEGSVDLVIVPGYRALEADAAALDARLAELCAEPGAARLAAAHDARRVAQHASARTAAWSLGPAIDEHLGAEISYWPARIDTIEATAAGADAVTAEWAAGLGASAKGLPAIEHLLFGYDDDASALAALSGTRRCEYLVALGGELASDTAALADAWDPAYGELLATAGPGNETWPMQMDALSALLTQMIEAVASIETARLGRPLGTESGGVVQPDAVESLEAGASIDSAIAVLEGVRALWLVEGGADGLAEWVHDRAPALADRVVAEIDAAIAALREIPEPFPEYLAAGDLSRAEAAQIAVRLLERTLATDVSAAIALTISFTDNDGD